MTTGRLIKVLCLLTGVFGVVWWFFGPTRPADKYLIPDGYVGWVRVYYEEPTAKPLPFANGYKIIRYNASGRCYTSEKLEAGRAFDVYVYVTPDGKEKRLDDAMIHNGSNGTTEELASDGKTMLHYYSAEFFVGTEAQEESYYKKYGLGPLPDNNDPHSHRLP